MFNEFSGNTLGEQAKAHELLGKSTLEAVLNHHPVIAAHSLFQEQPLQALLFSLIHILNKSKSSESNQVSVCNLEKNSVCFCCSSFILFLLNF